MGRITQNFGLCVVVAAVIHLAIILAIVVFFRKREPQMESLAALAPKPELVELQSAHWLETDVEALDRLPEVSGADAKSEDDPESDIPLPKAREFPPKEPEPEPDPKPNPVKLTPVPKSEEKTRKLAMDQLKPVPRPEPAPELKPVPKPPTLKPVPKPDPNPPLALKPVPQPDPKPKSEPTKPKLTQIQPMKPAPDPPQIEPLPKTPTRPVVKPVVIGPVPTSPSSTGSSQSKSGSAMGSPGGVAQGTGAASGNIGDYHAQVHQAFSRSWSQPRDIMTSGKKYRVKTEISIGRDGRILSARIVQASDHPLMNQSVADALNRVRNVPPLPDIIPGASYQILLNFDL